MGPNTYAHATGLGEVLASGDPVAELINKEGMALYHPGNRKHAVEWVPDADGRFFIGVSSLVKERATAYEERIRLKAEDNDPNGGFYGEQGNGLAYLHFRQLTPYREIQVRHRLSETHDIVGHIDAVIVRNESGKNISFALPSDWPETIYLEIGEHKHQDPDQGLPGGNIDLARRQAVDYAIMLQRQLQSGVRYFVLATFAVEEDPEAVPLTIPQHCAAKVWGTSIRLWPRTEPKAMVSAEPLQAWQAEGYFDRLCRKARAILEGPETARAWDLSMEGVQEFTRSPKAVEIGLPNEELLVTVLKAELAARYEEQWAAEKKDKQAVTIARMGEEKSVVLTNPADIKDAWAKPSVRSNKHGTTWMLPNLRGAWSTERILETLKAFESPLAVVP